MKEKKTPAEKNILLYKLTGLLLLLSAFIYYDAVDGGPLFKAFYPALDSRLLALLARISGCVPFSLFGVLLTLLIAGALVNLLLAFRKKGGLRRFLAAALAAGSFFLFAFTGLWGVNHFGEELYAKLQLSPVQYTKEDLFEAGKYCAEQANAAMAALKTNAKGAPLSEGEYDALWDFDALAALSPDGFLPIARKHSTLPLPKGLPKPLLYSRVYSYLGYTGFYFCYTGEACVNRYTYPSALPVTMCHELAHSICVAPEDAANFLGFLSCLENSDSRFVYSAWYMGYIWCCNSLYKIDRELFRQLDALCSEDVKRDMQQTSSYYDQYEGPVQTTAQNINNAYLKLYREELGVESYDAAVSYLVNWYLAGCPL